MRGFVTLLWTDLKLSLRNIVASFFTLAFPLLMLLLFGTMFRGTSAMDLALPGYIVTLVIGSSALMGLPVELAGRREKGVLKRFRATPVPPAALLCSQLSVALVVSALGTCLLLVTGHALWRLPLPQHPVPVILGFLLCAAAHCTLGLVIAALRSVRAALAVSMAIFYPMMFLSGGTIPLGILPEGVRRVSAFLPMTWAVTVMRDLWSGGGWSLPELARLGALLVVGGVVSVLVVRWD